MWRIENLPQHKQKHVQTARTGSYCICCSFFDSFREPFSQPYTGGEGSDYSEYNRQGPRGVSVQLGDPAGLCLWYLSVLHYHTVEKSQTAQEAPLPSPQTGQTSTLTAGHMETLNRSSSTDILLLLYSDHSPPLSLSILNCMEVIT